MLRNWLSDFTLLRRILPTQKRRQLRHRYVSLARVSRHAEVLEDRTLLAGVMYDASTDQLDFNADAAEVDNVTIGAIGANTLVIQVGNGDAILLSGDATLANGFTLSTTTNLNDTLTIDTSVAPLVNFNLNLGDMEDTLTLANDLSAVITGTLTINGGAGNDILDAGLGQIGVIINGGAGVDTITGGAGDDLIIWNNGDGNDLIAGGAGSDEVQINTGPGGDTINITPVAPDSIQVAGTFILTIRQVETISLNSEDGDDTITVADIFLAGDVMAVNIDAGTGNDTVTGNGDGIYTINGGDGNDTITGGGGNDALNGGIGNDTITGSGGGDTIDGGDGDDTLSGSSGNDIITGGIGTDTLNGGDNEDLLDGGAGTDTIHGDAGNDTMTGGGGADILFGDSGNDTFNITPNPTGEGLIIVFGGTPDTLPGDVLNYFGTGNEVDTPGGVGSGIITDTGFDSVTYTEIETVNDGPATLSIGSVSQVEGDSGQSNFVFTLTLDRPVDVAVSVEVSTMVASGPTAAAPGVDFTTKTEVVTFQPGETTQMFSVVILGNTIQEFNDIFLVDLDNLQANGRAVQISSTNGTGTGTILNDDTMLVVAAGFGGGPHVLVYDQLGTVRLSFFAFDSGFIGGVRVAAGDMTGDGTPDIIAAAGPGGGPHVRIFDGVTGVQIDGPLGSFWAYDPGFTGGVFVAVADLNGDMQPEVITGAGAGGGPHVRALDGNTGAELLSFFAYDPAFTGGVHVAAGDVTGDDKPEIVTGSGLGMQSRVRTFDGTTGLQIAGPLGDFFAYNPDFIGGTFVAVADVNGDMRGDIITGADALGGPHIRTFNGLDGSEMLTYYSHASSFLGGIRIAVGDVTGDGTAEIISGQGPGGRPHVQTFDGTSGQVISGPLGSFFAFDINFTGGVFVAGVVQDPSPIFTSGDFEFTTFDAVSLSLSESLDNEFTEESDDWDPDQLFADENLLNEILTEEFV